MQTKLNKSKKIILDTRLEKKLTKLVLLFSHFPAQSSILNHFQTKYKKQTKTLINSKEAGEQVAPLKTTPHKESNKIRFSIFRAVHK